MSEDLRYPIGKFVMPEKLSKEMVKQNIDEITTLPVRLSNAIAGWDAGQLDTSYREGGWTVSQVIHHIADSHMNSFVRFKLALTEDKPTIKAYEEALWAEQADYLKVDPMVSIKLIEALHHRWSVLLLSLDKPALNKGFIHPQQNKEILLYQAIGMYAWHGNHHLAHIIGLKNRSGW